MIKEPYQAVVEAKTMGVRIKVTAEADDDTDMARAEADRRARVIVDHFNIIINSA